MSFDAIPMTMTIQDTGNVYPLVLTMFLRFEKKSLVAVKKLRNFKF